MDYIGNDGYEKILISESRIETKYGGSLDPSTSIVFMIQEFGGEDESV